SKTTTTDATGAYQFTNLRPGTYTITETQPASYLDGKDSLGSLGGVLSNDQFGSVNVPVGAQGSNYNFGEVMPGTLSGFVYYDPNNTGTKDAGEPGIANVVITLTGPDDLGPSVSKTTTTDGTGFYQFTNLRPGTYTVAETQPANYMA